MQHERYVGYEIKALSNLLRRRLWGPADHPQSMLIYFNIINNSRCFLQPVYRYTGILSTLTKQNLTISSIIFICKTPFKRVIDQKQLLY